MGKKGITGNQLKILAALFMTVDHIGLELFPDVSVLRIIGRLAMPIFAWMIAEGCTHTRNKSRYLLTMLLAAVAYQLVFWLQFRATGLSIFATFSLSIGLIYGLDYANKRKDALSFAVLAAVFVLVCIPCVILPQVFHLKKFAVQYGLCGVLLPALIYVGKTKVEKLFLAACGMAMMALSLGDLQWYALLCLPLLALYNGQRGKWRMKYFFYLYYPLHRIAIIAVNALFFD